MRLTIGNLLLRTIEGLGTEAFGRHPCTKAGGSGTRHMRDAADSGHARNIGAGLRGWQGTSKLPSPLVGEGRFAKRNGVRGLSPQIETPDPARIEVTPPSCGGGGSGRQP